MTEPVFRSATIQRAAGAERVLDVVASTDTVDSYGDSIDQGSWQLARYAANPVVLYGHATRDLPIGTAENVRVENGALRARLRLVSDEANPKAGQVWRLIEEGALRAVSVGFLPHTCRWEKRDDREVFVMADCELLEISVVPVPANPDALAQLRARALSTKDHRPMSTTTDPRIAALEAITGTKAAEDHLAAINSIAAEKAARTAAEAERDAARAELVTVKRDAIIAKALAERKLTPGQKAWAEKQSPESLAEFLATAAPQVPAAGANPPPAGRGASPAAGSDALATLAQKAWGELTPMEKHKLHELAPDLYAEKKAAAGQ